MPYTSSDLLQNLAAMGLTGQETILIHSSMRSIGAVEGGGSNTITRLCRGAQCAPLFSFPPAARLPGRMAPAPGEQ